MTLVPMLKRSQVEKILRRCREARAAGLPMDTLDPDMVVGSALTVELLCEALLDAWNDYHSAPLPEDADVTDGDPTP